MSSLPIVVQKFGGSSVADAQRLKAVAERVASTHRSQRRVVVVVSAMGKTTDQLIALARSLSDNPPRRELDMLLSTGERISMALLAMALEDLGVPAISFTGSQSGILTNDRHSGARIIEVRPVRIQDELERGKVVIVAGFQGMSYKREITTLGRGGSDTTAVALAAALGAEACEIYSDVDGVYSADPRVVEDATRIDQIGYLEMQELAEHGAKVLNAQAVEWARRAGVVLWARATGGPVGGGRGETRIGGVPSEVRGALAIACSRQLTRLSIAERDALPALLSVLAAEGVCLRHLAVADRLTASLCRDDIPDWPRVRQRLEQAFPSADLREVAAVTAVGPAVGADPQYLARALHALEGVAPIDGCETSPLRLTLTVPPSAVDDATRALHRALIVER